VTRASERADAAYQTLHRAIIEQALEPGTKLREDQLGAHFGISRTLVRIALARLVGEGLVERRHRRSAMVARPTLKEARDAFERAFILTELRAHEWNMTRTAERLGIERSHLYRKLKAYGISAPK
jgi:DNA-binding GntR family transcriptional regulator